MRKALSLVGAALTPQCSGSKEPAANSAIKGSSRTGGTLCRNHGASTVHSYARVEGLYRRRSNKFGVPGKVQETSN